MGDANINLHELELKELRNMILVLRIENRLLGDISDLARQYIAGRGCIKNLMITQMVNELQDYNGGTFVSKERMLTAIHEMAVDEAKDT